jgi:hypothetical protein
LHKEKVSLLLSLSMQAGQRVQPGSSDRYAVWFPERNDSGSLSKATPRAVELARGFIEDWIVSSTAKYGQK